jgi:hypothetical protein
MIRPFQIHLKSCVLATLQKFAGICKAELMVAASRQKVLLTDR